MVLLHLLEARVLNRLLNYFRSRLNVQEAGNLLHTLGCILSSGQESETQGLLQVEFI